VVLLRYYAVNVTIAKHLMMRIRYVFQRNDTCYWQRKIPSDLLDRYPSSGPLKVNLRTLDPAVISSKVATLNRQHEALWAAMRKDPTLTPVSARDEAKKLLKGFGIEPQLRDPHEADLEGFFAHIDSKREDYADRQQEPEEAYHGAPAAEYLSKPELEALKILKGGNQFLLSDALDIYLDEHPKRGQPGFAKLEIYTRRVWNKLLDLHGDRVFTEVTRDEARAFRDLLMVELKTDSVRRNLSVIRAVFAAAIREKPIKNHDNVWEALKISGEGTDVTKRETLDPSQMATLRDKCKASDDAPRWVLSIQLDAGTRIAEVVGLALSDIKIDGEEVPYVELKPHPWRTLKNDGSIRDIPLVGHALWAARRVIETATKGQIYAFPQYIKDGECQASTASATLNKWMRAAGVDRTTHCFRHTMRDRLRNTGATKDIQDAVGGWGKSSDADNYGHGYALARRHKAMLKTIPV
jgi:integrase